MLYETQMTCAINTGKLIYMYCKMWLDWSTGHWGAVLKTKQYNCCESDPIPTLLLKKILPSIIDLITDIFNKSMLGGQFPEEFKEALVKPLLKKINLELIKKNYRLV